MRRPEPAERRQPGIHLLERLRFQPVETALRVHRGFYETGLAQHAQVLGHRWLGHSKLALDVPNRLLRRHQKAQYRAAVRLRNDFEHGFHSSDIPHGAYACQGIYADRDSAQECGRIHLTVSRNPSLKDGWKRKRAALWNAFARVTTKRFGCWWSSIAASSSGWLIA